MASAKWVFTQKVAWDIGMADWDSVWAITGLDGKLRIFRTFKAMQRWANANGVY